MKAWVRANGSSTAGAICSRIVVAIRRSTSGGVAVMGRVLAVAARHAGGSAGAAGASTLARISANIGRRSG